MHRRGTCPPHDENDAQMIELVSEAVHLGAVVGKGVECGGEEEAGDYAEAVYRHRHAVRACVTLLGGSRENAEKSP